MIDSSLLPDFIAEAGEHLNEMEANLIRLESEPGNKEILNDIFRAMHTIKGSSAYLGLNIISELSHKIENLLEILRQGRRSADPDLIDTLIAARDRIAMLVTDVERYQEVRTGTDDLIEVIDRYTNHLVVSQEASGSQGKRGGVLETVGDETPIVEKGHPSHTEGMAIDQIDPAIDPQGNEAASALEKSETRQSCGKGDFALELDTLIDGLDTCGASPDIKTTVRGKDASSFDNGVEDGDENYEESADEELFAIFLEQLKDNLSGIQCLMEQLPGSDNRSDLLSGIIEKIGRLKASANYMGYSKLTDLYDRWQGQLEAYQNQLFLGEVVANAMLVNTGVNAYITMILARFPQIEEITVTPVESYEPAIVQGKENAAVETVSFKLDALFEKENDDEALGSDRPSLLEDDDATENLAPALNRPAGDTADDDTASADENITFQENSSGSASEEENWEEIYEESSDKELFAIFLGQLKDNLFRIQTLAAQLPDSDRPSDLLNRVIEKIKRLRASANYMGYEKLIYLYDCWLIELDEFQDDLFIDDAANVSQLVDTRINAYFIRVFKHFPQIEPFTPGSTVVAETGFAEEEQPVGDNDLTSDSANVPSAPGTDIASTAPEINGVYPTVNSSGQPSGPFDNYHDLTETDVSLEDDRPIADQLARAFDMGLPINEVDAAPEDRTAELFSIDEDAADEEEFTPETDRTTVANEPRKNQDHALIDRLALALDHSLGRGAANEKRVAPEGRINDIFPKEMIELPAQDELESQPVSKGIVDDKAKDGDNTISGELSEAVKKTAASVETASVPEAEEQREAERRLEKRQPTQPAADKVVRQSLRVDANKIDELMNQAGELVINRAWFAQLFNEMKEMEAYLYDTSELNKRDFKQVKNMTFKFNEAIVALGRVANELQEGVMKVRMLPISQLYNRYPRLVRDLVHGTDKEIQLEIRGADTELDKMIIEEISDPLIHIIRNAVDHGIESVETRKRLGKPDKGSLRLDAYHEGSHVVVEVVDDGRGIDPETIKAVALKKGLLSEDELSRMSSKELLELIMRPGFSTTDQVTQTSGRGVGMDVVKENLENLNGTIDVDSQPGKGTLYSHQDPLDLGRHQGSASTGAR